ncbi:LysE family translocator [Ferrimonas sp. SCSIO 43195]|uniref:LysE family translocator n=1 Tax=Ferrimonas sp. SCSIO 43195 TaxID=2822844 RepID=UPI002074E6D7|nr:LysE family translocator [Ferrimonas sp. SCSIO 43195]USD39277.1 LysE family translocator [Ferrimonas sp. SCSIO 43195]
MTFLTWLPLATVCVLGALSPGPSLALVINNTVQRGTATGLRTALGHGIGVALYALITAMGLGLLISQTPWLFDGIKYAGAAFLVYMAIKILLAKPNVEGQSRSRKTRFVGFGGGFMVAFLNPKLAIFFLALFSQFVRADLTLGDQLLMMATAGGIDALWYAAVALGIGRTGLLGWLQRHGIWVDRVSAVIFLLLATAVVLQ